MSLGGGASTAHHSAAAAYAGAIGGAATGFSGGSIGAVPEQLLRDVITSTARIGSGDMNGEFYGEEKKKREWVKEGGEEGGKSLGL